MRTLFPHLDERIPLGHPGEYQSVKGPKNTLNSAKASELLGLSCEWSRGLTGGMQAVPVPHRRLGADADWLTL
jgi:hypothetical protein